MKNEATEKQKLLYQVALKAAERLELGTQVLVNPLSDLVGFDNWRKGTVTYINRENGWFLVEYITSNGKYTLTKAYPFISIGKEVYLNEEMKITINKLLENAC